ncbi:Alpha/Beta hydrolase protein [Amylocarpus encephaloides]|uniref:Carboxylic ester hydrolase n=1 Tax=Amylocarpus encephaloides TaxID=45428 RepID=A0A9P7YAB5_9HELO|nr:Alpha/Beta hydrolase protein [Amylocarpus encephaloides]
MLSIGILATALFSGVARSNPFVVDAAKKVSYQGITSSPGIETFLGIPFGQDTSGANRFAPPRAYVPSPGQVLDATAAGPSCPQSSSLGMLYSTVVTDISENCLSLLVARPAGVSRGAKLPVMAYIYGGGLNTGTAYDRTSRPDGLIQQSVENGLPVLYVGMNYRLNAFGFLTSEALRGDRSLNVGLKDQRLALEWVQENIAAFGGDPDHVTLFGQSSGGLSVGMQLLAYGNTRRAPFRAVILQSTALEPTMASNLSFNATSAIAVAASCEATDALSTAPELIECLRALPMEKLLNLTLDFIASTSANNDGDVFLPTVDQDFLPDLASSLIADGKFPRMPYIAGWQANDATLFTSTAIQTDHDTRAFLHLYYPDVNRTTLRRLLDLYPVGEFQANLTANLSAEFYRSAQVFRDILLVCPGVSLGAAMARKYCGAAQPPVYLYQNNQTILDNYLDASGSPGLGVIHTSELAYLSGNLSIFNVTSDISSAGLVGYDFEPRPSDVELARQWPRSWTGFAYAGYPSMWERDTLPGWTSAFPGGEGGGRVYVAGGSRPGMRDAGFTRLDERCGFLNRPEVIEQLRY